jgi:hypothetical protein
MKSINVVYQNGHFYDKETKQRIALKKGEEFLIAGSEKGFEIDLPPAGQKANSQTDKNAKTEKEVTEAYEKGINHETYSLFKKVLDAGKQVFFQISLSGILYSFRVELLEDLYIYQKVKGKNYRLMDCSCCSTDNIESNIGFFEPVYGKSLNDVYKCTYVHYFGNTGHSTSNSMDRFFLNLDFNDSSMLRNHIESALKKLKAEPKKGIFQE